MPRISSFMLSETISQYPSPQGLKPALIAPIQVIAPPSIPTSFTFGIALGIMDLNTLVSHNMKIVIQNDKESDNLTVLQEGIIPAIPNDPNVTIPDDLQGFVVTLVAQNVYLKTAGSYSVIVEIDGEKLSPTSIASINVVERDGAEVAKK